MSYEYRTDIRDNPALRASFNALTRRVFDFDFADWHARGWWSSEHIGYTPHALVKDGEVVANVSSTPLNFIIAGEPVRALQLGTVMTKPELRGQGLQRVLMERVLGEAAGQYDMIYLYANDSVVDFYPKFGFVPATEYSFSRAMPQGVGLAATPANMDDPAACGKLLALYKQGNPFTAAQMVGAVDGDNPHLWFSSDARNAMAKELADTMRLFAFDLLGLKAEKGNSSSAREEAFGHVVDMVLELRAKAKAAKDWATSDQIRDALSNAGFEVKDTKDGVTWKLNK